MVLFRAALRPSRCPLVAITITGVGTATSRVGSQWSVPKRGLIASAQVALQQQQLRIAAGLNAAQALVDELVAHRVKVSDDGHDSYGNGRDTQTTISCLRAPSPSTLPPASLEPGWSTPDA